MTLAREFFTLFAGLERAHGVFTLGRAADTGAKQKGRAAVEKQPLTEKAWELHLSGKKGLGVMPLRDDGTVSWAAIDIDRYDLDINAMEALSNRVGLPLMIVRSKSGGAHAYLFFKEPIQAKKVVEPLTEWAIALGAPGSEIFPKQVKLKEDDFGNWINMPYFKADQTTRYAVLGGSALSAEDFVRIARKRAITEKEFLAVKPKMDDVPEEFNDGPPCLQVLTRQGFPDGSRNNALFDLGVFARKRYGEDDYESHIWRYNETYMSPGTSGEVRNVIKSVAKKDYEYMCMRPPISNFCDRKTCLKRKYGVGGGAGRESGDMGVELGDLVMIGTNPKIWKLAINGTEVMMTSDDLLSQRRFRKVCLEQALAVTNPIKESVFIDSMRALVIDAEKRDAPDDAGPEGHFWHHVERFLTERKPGENRDDLLRGKPVVEDGRIYFRAPDLLTYLDMHRFRAYQGNQIYVVLKDRAGVEKHTMKIKGRCVQCWSVPDDFARQNEEFDVPEMERAEF